MALGLAPAKGGNKSMYTSGAEPGDGGGEAPQGRGRLAERQPRRPAQSQEEADDWKSPSDQYFDPPTPSTWAPPRSPAAPGCGPEAAQGAPAFPIGARRAGGPPPGAGAGSPGTQLSTKAQCFVPNFVPMGAAPGAAVSRGHRGPPPPHVAGEAPGGLRLDAPAAPAQFAGGPRPQPQAVATVTPADVQNKDAGSGGRAAAGRFAEAKQLTRKEQRALSPGTSSSSTTTAPPPCPAAVYVDLSCLRERTPGERAAMSERATEN